MTTTDSMLSRATAVRSQGFATWPGFVDETRIRRLAETAHRFTRGGRGNRYPKSTRVWDVYRRDAGYAAILDDPRLTELLTALLGEHYLLSDYSLNVVGPGQPVDDWHIDYPYNEMDKLTEGSILGLQCVLALDRFSVENGATRLVPRSHLRPRRPDPDAVGEEVPFLAEPGTLLIMAAATWHRSGFNSSRRPRAAALLSFVERWVRPMSDPRSPGPWAANERLRIMFGMERPPETINGVPV